MREMLKDTGSFYFHCDPTMSHYIKVILDYIFGIRNFRNEIIWSYRRFSRTVKNRFPSMHDIILFYSKSINNNYKPIPDELKGKGHIERGYHTVVDGGEKKLLVYNKEKAISSGVDFSKYAEVAYVKGEKTILNDIWELPILNPMAKERLGYPTQKPEKLLERIILASSNENDLVADLFMGGGTTPAVAIKNNRKFLGVDINSRAIQITQERIEKLHMTIKKDFFIYGIPRSAAELRKMVLDNIYGKDKNSRFALEDVTVKHYLNNVVGNEKKVGDHSIDGYFVFTYNGKQRTGIVQVTSGAGIGHFKSFCSEVGKGTGELGVYIAFQDKITSGMIREAKVYGKIGNVDKIQILPFEELIDKGKQFEVPKDILTI